MKRPKQRTRELSTQNYRRSKLSYQNISHNTKKTTSDKCRQLNKEISCDEFHKVNPLGPKLPICMNFFKYLSNHLYQLVSLQRKNLIIFRIPIIQSKGSRQSHQNHDRHCFSQFNRKV